MESHLSWVRSRLSAERTLMAYARSSISFIALGFVIYEYVTANDAVQGLVATRGVTRPEWLGLGLMVAGVVLLVVGINDYRAFLSDLMAKAYGDIGQGRLRLRPGTQLMVTLLFLAAAFGFVIILFNP